MSLKYAAIAICVCCLTQPKESSGYSLSTSDTDGGIKEVCAGDDVIFPWRLTTTSSEKLLATQWNYQGTYPQIIATANESGFIPTPVFANRVTPLSNQGIALHHMTSGDSGVYSVMVKVANAEGNPVFLEQHTLLRVVGDDLTAAGTSQVGVLQQSRAVFNNVTGRWAVELTCGPFQCPAHPSHAVEWLLPSGRSVASSGYRNGSHFLLVDSPVEGGLYTCSLPSSTTLRTGRNASVVVDTVSARVSILEAEQSQLVAKNRRLQDQVILLTDSQTHLSQAMCQAAVDVNVHQTNCSDSSSCLLSTILTVLGKRAMLSESQVLRQNIQLYHKVQSLEQQLTEVKANQTRSVDPGHLEMGMLEFLTSPKFASEADLLRRRLANGTDLQMVHPHSSTTGAESVTDTPARGLFDTWVGFHARQTRGNWAVAYTSNTPIVFGTVDYQTGGGYDPSTGIFTAPKSGLYLIAFSGYAFRNCRRLKNNLAILTVNQQQIAWAHSSYHFSTYYQSASVQAVFGLSRRDVVFVNNVYDNSCWYSGTFSVARID